MAYIYVKSGGTATGTGGRYTDAKTGSWSTAFTDPSQYYGTLASAFSGVAEADGDFIILSNLHNASTSGSGNYSLYTSVKNIKILSVDDTDVSILLPGATENYTNTSTSVTYNVNYATNYTYGLILNVNAAFNLVVAYNDYGIPDINRFEKCKFIVRDNSTLTANIELRKNAVFLDCEFDLGPNTNYYLKTSSTGSTAIFKNCVFKATTSSTIPLFVNSTLSSNYGLFIEFDGCDFSQANRPLLQTSTSTSNSSSTQKYSIIRCKEASNTRNNILYGGQCDPIGYYYSGNTKYLSTQYYPLGIVDSDTSVYRNDGAEYISGEYFSYKVTTRAEVTPTIPLSFKLADFYLDTSTTKTFTVELLQENGSTPLTDYQFSIDVYYVDDLTSKAHRKSSFKILPSTNDLSTSSKTWTGLTDPVKQYISLTTSEIGSYGLCSVYVNIFVPNRTIYICPKIDIT